MLRNNETVEAAARAAPILSRPDELRFARAWLDHGDLAAREALFRSHLRLVVKAARTARFRTSFDEMLSEGCIGLLLAIDRYDPDTGFRLSTYAPFWIRAQIGDHVFQSANVVRLPGTATIKTAMSNISRVKRSLGFDVDRRMGPEQLRAVADAIGIPVDSVQIADARLCGIQVSADAPLRRTGSQDETVGSTLIDLMPSKEPSPHDAVQRNDRERWAKSAVGALLRCLTERERDIYVHRVLDRDMTLEELASVYGVSRERIRQIEVKAEKKIAVRASSMRAIAMAHLHDVVEDVAA